MHIFSIITDLRFQDVFDILFLSVLVYHLYLWFWGTKAFKALVGLLAMGVIFTLARFWGLFLTTWVFQILWQVLVVLIIILFQSEIRQVLERVNPLQMITLRRFSKSANWIPDIVTAIFSLAKIKTGALIIFERADLVEELITGGIPLESELSPELLMSIFHKESPLHDGALLIRRGRIAKAACYLPLSSVEGLPKEWGTRHRAALGLSERCDASIVVISEERGEISVAQNSKIIHVSNIEQLSQLIKDALESNGPASKSWPKMALSLTVHKWPIKVIVVALVCLFWLLLAGQQNFEVTIKVPLDVKNLPEKIEVIEPVNPEIAVTVQGLRKDASTLSRRNVHAEVDISMARFGNRVFRITRNQITLPNDRIKVVSIEPPLVEFRLRETLNKNGAYIDKSLR